MLTRRELLRLGLLTGGAACLPGRSPRKLKASSRDRLFDYTPFTSPVPKPPVLLPTTLSPAPGTDEAAVGSDAVFHGIAPEYARSHPDHADDWDRLPELHYVLDMVEGSHEFFPGVRTPIFGYSAPRQGVPGIFPGPTLILRHGQPAVLRTTNRLHQETSLHCHGHHNPAHSDGYPDFFVLPGKTRDYYYPNIGPRLHSNPRDGTGTGEFELSHLPTTLWYHDHGMDITGLNVSHGLAAFALFIDDHELRLIDSHVLPTAYGRYDIPLVLVDQEFNADGTLPYDFFDHNGRIGDVFTVNGKVQPYLNVERRKYRFRLLNGSNARYYHLRLNSSPGRRLRHELPFLVIGKDAWELPKAFAVDSFPMSPADRFDVIVDFGKVPDNVDAIYLQNIMVQEDGRKPDGVDSSEEHTALVKFNLVGPRSNNDLTVEEGDSIRPFTRIREDEIVTTRRVPLARKHGAWVINDRFFSPRRTDATVLRNSAERWIVENKAGGWWHPLHIHLEAQQIQRINGVSRRDLPPYLQYNVDVTNFEGGDEIEIFVKFRTFKGPFVFHCHNLEHEDMRMMGVFDPRDAGEESMNDGVRPHSATQESREQSGMPEEPDPDELLFEHVGDVDRLEGEGVGIPHDDFDPAGNQLTPGGPVVDD